MAALKQVSPSIVFLLLTLLFNHVTTADNRVATTRRNGWVQDKTFRHRRLNVVDDTTGSEAAVSRGTGDGRSKRAATAAGTSPVRNAVNSPLRYEVVDDQPARTLAADLANDIGLRLTFNRTTMSKVRYVLSSVRPKQALAFLRLDPELGRLETTHPLDRETLCGRKLQLCVIYLDVHLIADLQVRYFDVVKVEISVRDVNDNAPAFDPSSVSLELDESQIVGTVLSMRPAVDNDSPDFGVKKYQLLTDSSNTFRLDVESNSDKDASVLRLALIQPLDYEQRSNYTLHVIASDGGNPSLSGTLTINVNVHDVNDNSPTFDRSTYDVSVPEDAPVGLRIFAVHANDSDRLSDCPAIRYSFAPHTAAVFGGAFALDGLSGTVRLIGPLDYERTSAYRLAVVARDCVGINGDVAKNLTSLSATAVVVVNVIDANDNPPQITVDTLTFSDRGEEENGDGEDWGGGGNGLQPRVFENSPVGTLVAHVSVQDHDSGDNGRVSCALYCVGAANVSSDFKLVEVFRNEYKIVTTRVFDCERVRYVLVFMTCRDHGVPSLSATANLNVTVVDVDDNKPTFTREIYEATATENAPVDGRAILVVSAVDADVTSAATFRYAIESGAGVDFAVDNQTGAVTALRQFDRESAAAVGADVIEFTVIATIVMSAENTFTPPIAAARAQVRICIADVDDNIPTFDRATYVFDVPEDSPMLMVVGSVLAIDGDLAPFNRTFYDIVVADDFGDASEEDEECFAISMTTGVLTVKCALDREEIARYSLVARSYSENSLTHVKDKATVMIRVTDVNDNYPIFDFPISSDASSSSSSWRVSSENTSIAISRSADVGSVVVTLRAHDDDEQDAANSRIVFRIANESDFFHVEPETGKISLSKPLNDTNTTNELITLAVIARDCGQPSLSSSATLTIVVYDALDAITIHAETNLTTILSQSSTIIVLETDRFIALSIVVGCLMLIMVIVIIITIAYRSNICRIISKYFSRDKIDASDSFLTPHSVGSNGNSGEETPSKPTPAASVVIPPSATAPDLTDVILKLDKEPVNYSARYQRGWHVTCHGDVSGKYDVSCERDVDSVCTEMTTSATSYNSSASPKVSDMTTMTTTSAAPNIYNVTAAAYFYNPMTQTWPRRSSQCLDSPSTEEFPPPPSPLCRPQHHHQQYQARMRGQLQPLLLHQKQPLVQTTPSSSALALGSCAYERQAPVMTTHIERTTTFGVRKKLGSASSCGSATESEWPTTTGSNSSGVNRVPSICRVPRTFSTNGSLSDFSVNNQSATSPPFVPMSNLPPPMSLQLSNPVTTRVLTGWGGSGSCGGGSGGGAMIRSASSCSRKSVRFAESDDN